MSNTREDMNEIRFERVHRLSTRQNSQTRTKPRPIIAKYIFRWYDVKIQFVSRLCFFVVCWSTPLGRVSRDLLVG